MLGKRRSGSYRYWNVLHENQPTHTDTLRRRAVIITAHLTTPLPGGLREVFLDFLCTSEQLPEGHARGFEQHGKALLAVRRSGEVFVYLNRCPHRHVRLDWQPDQFLDHSASLIRCATHGALFLIESGECVAGPCEGQSLKAIACRENADGVWVKLPEAD